MANPIIQNYLNDLGSYYRLNPADQQQANQQQLGLGGILPRAGLNVAPVIGGFGSNNGTGGYSVNVIGGANILEEVRKDRQEAREENRATGAACIGAILTVVGAAGLACVMNGWNETSERLDTVRAFRDDQLPLFWTRRQSLLDPRRQ